MSTAVNCLGRSSTTHLVGILVVGQLSDTPPEFGDILVLLLQPLLPLQQLLFLFVGEVVGVSLTERSRQLSAWSRLKIERAALTHAAFSL